MDQSVLRRTIAALVMLALSLAGLGRALAAATDSGPATIIVGGFVISLCHTDDGSGSPQDTARHDCCDQCTLHAPVTLPGAAGLAAPLRIVHVVESEPAVMPVAAIARPRTPRVSQGPPFARA
ncbi:hypothetical protein [Labrys monachus]|uniref:DUF2946 domain-containing protein n=1 Tax=Labrys monachus TaxID=217067 RepID=A0ABU0FE45_9HYPH|nr:hypothetical protein [Labrys monachus]MDQ0392701.1 hypothetical protein [Labrys monachus]